MVVHADTIDGLVGVAAEMLNLLVEVGLRVVRQGSQFTAERSKKSAARREG